MVYRARPKKARRYRESHFWIHVEIRMTCHLGGHDVDRGGWIRMRRGDHRKFASCDTCLFRQYGIVRPGSQFTFHEDPAVDYARKRAGDDE